MLSRYGITLNYSSLQFNKRLNEDSTYRDCWAKEKVFLLFTSHISQQINNSTAGNMNIHDLKNIRIADLLARYGHNPASMKGHVLWYLSPLRAEHTPSFKVDTKKNVWYDFGLAKGGNIVALAILLTGTDDLAEVLRRVGRESIVAYQPQPVYRKENYVFCNVVVRDLSHIALQQYLSSRGISTEIAKRYCKEVHYTVNGKNYFAVGFPNRSGGYELRNAFFKSCIAPKDISIINTGDKVCHVFEGFIDFLSFVMLHGECDAVVLNSIVNVPKAIEVLNGYQQIVCHLDNDNAGRTATKQIMEQVSRNTTDASSEYTGSKDLNEYLCHQNHHTECASLLAERKGEILG